MAVMPDKTVLAADTHRRIRSYKFEEQLDFDVLVVNSLTVAFCNS